VEGNKCKALVGIKCLATTIGKSLVGGFKHVELENHKWFMVLL